jgi:hypothetical protein
MAAPPCVTSASLLPAELGVPPSPATVKQVTVCSSPFPLIATRSQFCGPETFLSHRSTSVPQPLSSIATAGHTPVSGSVASTLNCDWSAGVQQPRRRRRRGDDQRGGGRHRIQPSPTVAPAPVRHLDEQ